MRRHLVLGRFLCWLVLIRADRQLFWSVVREDTQAEAGLRWRRAHDGRLVPGRAAEWEVALAAFLIEPGPGFFYPTVWTEPPVPGSG